MEQDIMTGVRFVGAIAMIVMITLMAVANRGRVQSTVYNRSRWLIVTGSLLLFLHMVVQFFGHFREDSVAICWAINMAFFVALMPLYYLASVNILCAGHNMKPRYRRIGGFYLVCYSVMGIGYATDTLINEETLWKSTTFIVACCLFIMNAEMSWTIVKDMKKANSYLNDEELEERHEALKYLACSIKYVLLVSLTIPWWCMISSLLSVSLLAFCNLGTLIWYDIEFYIYGRQMEQVIEVNDELYEAAAIEEEQRQSPAQSHERADLSGATVRIEKWVSERNFTDPNLMISNALKQMNVSVTVLNDYIEKHTPTDNFRKWVSLLRIEETKRLLAENPDYKLDAIAYMVGMSGASSLCHAFKGQEGITPTQWMEQKKLKKDTGITH